MVWPQVPVSQGRRKVLWYRVLFSTRGKETLKNGTGNERNERGKVEEEERHLQWVTTLVLGDILQNDGTHRISLFFYIELRALVLDQQPPFN